ncbi:DUF4982 domain-containing protein [Puteibacter caeruleilacunae]|nr:DUF4982 domain-containing protein [Puteibacter caeruleilacunae]
MNIKFGIVLGGLLSIINLVYAQVDGVSPRKVLNMNTNWEFCIQEKHESVTPLDNRAEIKWEEVHLPHTPKIELKEFTTHWQGVCWYKRKFIADPAWENKTVLIKFEAVMQEADVWVNGKKLAKHLGGYLPFCVDVSSELMFDGKRVNEILVRADNRDNEEIPPGRNLTGLDMTYQGGIYRSVHMIIADKLHITDAVHANKIGGGGIHVTFENVSEKSAVIKVKTHVENVHASDVTLKIKNELVGETGKIVAESEGNPKVLSGKSDQHFLSTLDVKDPQLWHPNNPNLYRLITKVVKDDIVIDEVVTRIGIREIKWEKDGFYINGERLLLNGANRHQDGIYVGNALPENVQRLDALKLREAGFNNVRAGHYPLDPAFMDACDELGLTVIACIPGWHWYKESEQFKSQSYQNLRDLIRRDRNHPSVVLYETILNETRYSAAYARKTYEISKEESSESFAACDFEYPEHRMYDVNYKVPDASLPSFTREWGDDNRYCGIHKNDEGFTWGDWANRDDEHSMVYQSLARQKDLNGDGYWDWYGVNANSNMAGYALWVGFDHNRGATNNIARCGVWGLDRYEKFCYYFLQSQRDPKVILKDIKSGPMVFIGSYWRESSLKDVNVYSNCDVIKLYLNGKLIGTQKPDKFYNEGLEDHPVNHVNHPVFTFKNVMWEKGRLSAEGLINGKVVAKHEVRTPQEEKSLVVELDHINKYLTADGSDMAMMYIKAVDKDGTLVPDFDGEILVDIKGEGRLIGANPVKAEGGVAAIWIRSTTKQGKYVVTVENDRLGTTKLNSKSVSSSEVFVEGPLEAQPKRIRRVENHPAEGKGDGLTKIDDFKVTVSSTREGSKLDNLTDGDRETWWFAADNKNQWIDIELKKATDLNGSLIVWEKDSNWYEFSILVSKDGEEWKKVYHDSQTGHNFDLEEWNAKGVKFVKVKLESVKPGNGLLGIREIELFQ